MLRKFTLIMKPLSAEISRTIHSSVAIVEYDEPYFKAPYHFHPEIELVYVKEGFGRRIIGEKLDQFYPGDLVLLGSNLPHVWLNDPIFYKGFTNHRAHSLVIYFNKDIFSNDFYQMRESLQLNDLFSRALRGIKISGKTQMVVIEKMNSLSSKKGFLLIISVLELLHIISTSKEVEYVTHSPHNERVSKQNKDRLHEIYNYIIQNFNKEICLDDIAAQANMTPSAFCRYFKKRTNKNFIEYLNEVRISNACKYLLESSMNISEIAFYCGYKTVSNFNKIFKKTMSLSPKVYREKTNRMVANI